MGAHLGDLFIFLAAISGLGAVTLYALAWRGRDHLLRLARGSFIVCAASVLSALGMLLYLILTHDFSVAYVYSYSSTDLPLYFLISSLWGGQEGTFLLWLAYTVVFGLVMMRTARGFERGNMMFLSLFVVSLLAILLKKSPFEVMPVFRDEGAGLNPLLQNYWMVIHPPIMFVGFAAAAFPFCFALTGLVERKYHIWSEAARRWTLFGWTALGVSLVMGGYWAYETLGWGGFWAWDPVENSSLIPWLFLTAQVHTLFIKRQRRGLLRFSLAMVCLTFWSVLYGTFLTRSGVLADFSVHSFVDLGINQFLVGGLALFIALGASLLVWRWRDITPEPSYSHVASRSYLVTLGVVILFVAGWLVLLGTSAPLITRLAENPSNVGLPYYFATMTPIAIAILLLTGLFPAFRWNNGISRPLLLRLGLGGCLAAIAVLLVTGFTYHPMYLLLFGTAAWSLLANGWVLWLSWRERKLQPGYLSHVGLALAIVGAAVSSGFETKQVINLTMNQPTTVMGYTMTFTDMVQTPKGFDCHVAFAKGDEQFIANLPHEFPKNAEGVMKKPYVRNHLSYDLYVAPSAIELPKDEQPGLITLNRGQTGTVDKYAITFEKFDVSGDHGEDAMSAAARLTVAYDGQVEILAPRLDVRKDSVAPVAASFDSDRARVTVAAVQPETGAVQLQISGEFLAGATTQPGLLTIELSKKPLIILFWLGTIMAFLGGALSFLGLRRRDVTQTATVAEPADRPGARQPVATDAA